VDEHLIGPIVGSIITAVISAALGQLLFKKNQGKETSNQKELHLWWLASVSIGVVVFVLWRWGTLGGADPKLQGIQAKPNFVHPGDRVTISVQLDRPAPKNGVSIVLTSSDPAVLAVDGNAPIYEGQTVGTGYSHVVSTPSYPSPISVSATLNHLRVQTDVNVGDLPTVKPPPAAHPVVMRSSRPEPHPPSYVTVIPPAPKPAPLDAEVLGRFDEAQGQLASEESYWNGVKQHMPPGTSLRPEITSQIFAANSAMQRCKKARDAVDAASLSTCIDAVNDHLTQLKIQH